MLSKAITLAAAVHDGQFDKAGKPYIFHVLRVMLHLETEKEQIIGVLHDCLEDSTLQAENLKKMGYSEEILNTLICLTKKEEESYSNYIDRVLENPLACRIKLADLHDNMDLSRIKKPTKQDFLRIQKYDQAKNRILEKLEIDKFTL